MAKLKVRKAEISLLQMVGTNYFTLVAVTEEVRLISQVIAIR